MINLQKIFKIGYGFGFGGAFATNAKYTAGHKKTLSFFCINSKGNFILPNAQINDSVVISRLGFQTQKQILTREMLSQSQLLTIVEASTSLDQIILTSKVNTLSSIAAVDLQLNPVKSSQEILRKVPGLFIGQHAGGGKAEQIFLRGFDVDHGTDVAISVDGMPVNMVSHAHGQGYADLHFVTHKVTTK